MLSRPRRFVMGHAGKTDFARKRSSETHRGERNRNWKGGITKERDKLKASPEYKAWAFTIYSLDRFTCQLCGEHCKAPEAHHIRPVRDYPELILDIQNGVVLCGPCHESTYGKEHLFEEVLLACVAKRVNSGEAPPGNAEGNPEPSQGGNALEGVQARGRAYTIRVPRFPKPKTPCFQCGKLVQRKPGPNAKRLFCSHACKGKWQRIAYRKPKRFVATTCTWCGASMEREAKHKRRHPNSFCTPQCMGKFSAQLRWHGGNASTSALPERDDIAGTAQ